jgi:hypothetical protein
MPFPGTRLSRDGGRALTEGGQVAAEGGRVSELRLVVTADD